MGFPSLESLADWVVELDRDLRIVSVIGAAGQETPLAHELPVGLTLGDAIGADAAATEAMRLRLLSGRGLKSYQYEIDHGPADKRRYCLSVVPAMAEDNSAKGFHGTITMLSTADENDRLGYRPPSRVTILGAYSHIITVRDLDGRYVRANRAAAAFVGTPVSSMIGRTNAELLPAEMADDIAAEDMRVLTSERAFDFEQSSLQHDGLRIFRITRFPLFDMAGQVAGIGSTGIDITQRKRLESELDRHVNYDSLTELPNRKLARKLLDEAVLVAQHGGTRVGVLVADLSNFRAINDTLGHTAGDQILVEAAWRLRECVPEENAVARISGDEFAVIVPTLRGDADLDALAQVIFDAFDASFLVQGREVFTGVNVGSAVYPDDADGPEQALRYADLAMSAIRRTGADGYCRYTAELSADVERKSRIGALLRSAFARSEFHLNYQPLVDTQSGLVVAAEALLRWNSSELGVVGPDQFIPVAEETGMIISIGTWTLQTACQDAAAWCRDLGRPIGVAVNVSPRQLLAPGFSDIVAGVLARTGLRSDLLKIEVTEGCLVADVDLCRRVLQDLRQLGVILALDDFGTGYSALSYLQQFEFDILKLDQSFIRKAQPGTAAATLAASIISMAAGLGMKTVGEGVETADHVEMLKANGCDLMQGYHFSKPISRLALITLIEADGWTPDSVAHSVSQAA